VCVFVCVKYGTVLEGTVEHKSRDLEDSGLMISSSGQGKSTYKL